MKCNVVCIQTYPKMNQKERENLFIWERFFAKLWNLIRYSTHYFPRLAVTEFINVVKIFKKAVETLPRSTLHP